MSKYLLKAVPSEKDDRDYPLAMIAPPTGLQTQVKREYVGKVKNQGQIGACVAESATEIKEMQEYIETGKYTEFSVGSVYSNRLATDHQEPGMQPRQAWEGLIRDGIMTQEQFPELAEYPDITKYLTAERRKFYSNQIKSYARLSTVQERMKALATGAISICVAISPSFYDMANSKWIYGYDERRDMDRVEGYHEMTVLGYDSNRIGYVLNSWGEEWGLKGHCYIPLDSKAIVEAWALTDIVLPKKDAEKQYHVQVGAYLIKEYATRIKNSLVKLGYPKTEIVFTKGVYTVEPFVSTVEKDAKFVAKVLAIKKYKAKITMY